MKILCRYLPVLLLAGLFSCNEKETVLPDVLIEQDHSTTSHITISASLEQHADTGTKTSIGEGNAVVWNEGDSFDLLPLSGTKDVLVATVNQTSSGLGIPVSTSANHYIKYDGISVTVNGADQTKSITSTKQNSDNSYKVGIYNGNSKYQYAAAGTTVVGQINSYNGQYTLPLVQSSSSSTVSSTNQVVVRLSGIQYSSDNTNWISVDETTALRNGFGGKKTVSYEWQSRDGSNASKSTASITGGSSASSEFTAEITDGVEYIAAYPTATLRGDALNFDLPQTQHYAAGSFARGANPSAGRLTNNGGSHEVDMKNICGVLSVSLKGSGVVTAIELRDPSSKSLWGNASISISAIGETGATVTGGSSTLTLDCGAGVRLRRTSATPFYFVVPVGAFASGIEIAVHTETGVATKSASASNTISRSVIKAMPAVSTDGLVFSLPEFNIENGAAAEYLRSSISTFTSSAVGNYGSSYFNASRSYYGDQPNTKTISFDNPGTATVVMSESADYSAPVLEASVTGDSFELRNMIPGKSYYYKAVSGGTVLTSGAFTATGQVRMIKLDKGFNIRDIGGWTGWNGHKVRYGQVYRGASIGGKDSNGNVSDITDADRAEMKRLGIRAQLDLRAINGGGAWPGEGSLHSYTIGETPLLDADFNNTMTDYGYTDGDASVIADVAWIIYELKRGRPVYFNCRQGADRTGTIAFVIEGLLGCYGDDGHQMAMDYELTGFSHANDVDNAKVTSSARPAYEVYSNHSKMFYTIINLSVPGYSFNSMQEKFYYYLNQYAAYKFPSDKANNTQLIDKSDLDWFINHMLGTTDYTGPSWAVSTGKDLKTIAESKANVINYAN